MLLGIPFIINVLFKIYSPIYLFEAEWSAGDALGYYGDVLAFMGTVVLGALALYQNHIIKRLELLEDQYNKLKREVDDLSIDFKMFEHMNRR